MLLVQEIGAWIIVAAACCTVVHGYVLEVAVFSLSGWSGLCGTKRFASPQQVVAARVDPKAACWRGCSLLQRCLLGSHAKGRCAGLRCKAARSAMKQPARDQAASRSCAALEAFDGAARACPSWLLAPERLGRGHAQCSSPSLQASACCSRRCRARKPS
jgi:hypothetical protein